MCLLWPGRTTRWTPPSRCWSPVIVCQTGSSGRSPTSSTGSLKYATLQYTLLYFLRGHYNNSVKFFFTQLRSRLTYVPCPLHIENLPRIRGNQLMLSVRAVFDNWNRFTVKCMFDVPLCNHTACKPMIWKVTRQDRRIGQTHYILSYGHISVLHLDVFISGESSRCHDAVHARRQVGIVAMLDIKIGLIGS